MSLNKQIAKTIKHADRSYFFEDYSKQASAVLSMFRKKGYRVIPAELGDDIMKRISDEMATGKLRPEEHIKDVYQTMLRILEDEDLIH